MSRALLALCAAESRRFAMVRMRMIDVHPFWGHLLLHFRLIPAPELSAFAATDCVRRIWFNPRHTQHLDVDQLGFVLAHELGHHLLESNPRERGRDALRWNMATDYAINRIVARIGGGGRPAPGVRYRSPDGHYPELGQVRCLNDPRFDGLIAEAIYEQLLAERPPAGLRITVHLGTPGQGGGALDIDLPDMDVPGVMDHGGGIDVHLPVDLSEAEREELRDRVTAAVQSAEATAHRGDVPGELVREVCARGRSVVPWQRLLHRLVGEALPATEYSLSRPNRRYLAEDLLVPGLVGDGPERVVVAIDSSGSMSGETLAAACTELAALSHRVGEITVLIADAKVQRVIRPAELPEFLRQTRLPGGGGTKHEPVFAWIASQPWRPDLFVGLTDLFSSFPTARPNYPVLWIAPKRHGKAPWGTVVEVHSDRLDP